MPDGTNDNDHVDGRPPRPIPDAAGQAALLLSESMLHVLVEKGLLSSADAFDIVDTAQEVTIELADGLGEASQIKGASLALLAAIARSLRPDTR